MEHRQNGLDRRAFLQLVGVGALGTVVAGDVIGQGLLVPASAATTTLSLVATDGYITVPGREGNPLYIFGFVPGRPATCRSRS